VGKPPGRSNSSAPLGRSELPQGVREIFEQISGASFSVSKLYCKKKKRSKIISENVFKIIIEN